MTSRFHHWNHRVMRATHVIEPYPPEVMYSVHEVHYDAEGNPIAHTSHAIGVQGDTYREAAETWMKIQRAFMLPVLEYVDGHYRELEEVNVAS